MNGYWLLANAVLGLHVAVLLVLVVGLPFAALGGLRNRPRTAAAFWGLLVVAALWQTLPSCILTDMERWLRHLVEPAWDRTISVQRLMVLEVTGVDLREQVFCG